MSNPTAHVPLPDLLFDAADHPTSQAFGDVYFSRAGGVEETEHVFLEGNGLPDRWLARDHFTIGELGFGSGLNFLITWEKFLSTVMPSQHLHYLTVEKYPCTPEMLARMHANLPDTLQPLLHELLTNYPLRLPGWHRVQLERATLTIGFGDAEELLQNMQAQVDAWFLDGFAPAKNADMWSEGLLQQVQRLSAPGASFATFTAAGKVRRQMEVLGFEVQKIKGYAHKREMLVGELPAAPSAITRTQNTSTLIIGAGIAGATIAHALAERGHQVTVLERAEIAHGASGNPVAVLYPQLSKHYTAATAWHFSGYSLMLRQLQRWKEMGYQFASASPGMLRLPRPDQSASDYLGLGLDDSIAQIVTREEASVLAGMEVVSDGWWFPHGTWVSPKELCASLLSHPNISYQQAEVAAMSRDGDAWQVMLADGEVLRAEKVILANAQAASQLLPDYRLPMGISAGQITMFPAEVAKPLPQCIMSYLGYLIPFGESLLMGATYDHHDHSGRVTQANHEENIAHARAAFHGWRLEGEPSGGRTSLRATTPDHLPYVGEVSPGLYVSIGHGSRGLISAPLAAEVITAQIMGEPSPLSETILRAVHPLRRN